MICGKVCKNKTIKSFRISLAHKNRISASKLKTQTLSKPIKYVPNLEKMVDMLKISLSNKQITYHILRTDK